MFANRPKKGSVNLTRVLEAKQHAKLWQMLPRIGKQAGQTMIRWQGIGSIEQLRLAVQSAP